MNEKSLTRWAKKQAAAMAQFDLRGWKPIETGQFVLGKKSKMKLVGSHKTAKRKP